MSSIRRILSGISTGALWATRLEVTAPARQQPTAPVEPVRRGFSDHSDFQSSLEAERSPLETHTPNLAGRARRLSDPLRAYTGLSDFQAALPRYQHLLGTYVPPPPSRDGNLGRPSPTRVAAAPPPEPSLDSRPGPAATADLERTFERAGEEDSVRLYSAEGTEDGRSVIQHPDGTVTDPASPERRFADVQAWEQTHPSLTHTLTLSRNDLELVLAMPEGPARDEILSELASPDTGALEASTAGDDFLPSMEDLPVNAEPVTTEDAEAFMPSLEDVPGSDEPVEALTAEELGALLNPSSDGVEGQRPLEVAWQVALRGTPEMQARAATTLYERGQTPDSGDALGWQRGAALAASGSPEATLALLQHVGEARMADFVRTVMQA